MTRHVLTALLLSSTSLLAQGPGGPGGPTLGPAVTTTTDYGVVADLGGTLAFEAVAAMTTVDRVLEVKAREGIAPACTDLAAAGSRIQRPQPNGVELLEHAIVRNTDSSRGAFAGTSADAPSAASPGLGAHTFTIEYPNIGLGVDAIVMLRWAGMASTGASCTVDVDVDGGAPEFSAVADGTRVAANLQVVGGANGVTIVVTTTGQAALAADGEEYYHASLMVAVREGTIPTSCTFSTLPPSCGADLDGTVGPNLDLSLDVTNAAPDALGIMVIGPQLATPVPAPIGSCNLLVDIMNHGRWFQTDANGEASIPVRTPRVPLTISFQALILTFDPTATPRFNLFTSNGLELVCQ